MNANKTDTHPQIKRVFRAFYDPAKEEAWLQNMADQGWAFERATNALYVFRQCTPNTYIVKSALAENFEEKAHVEEMLADSGATICQIKNPFPWIYAIRDKSLGDFEINSTADSKAHSDALWLKRMRTILIMVIVLIAMILIGTPGVFYGNKMEWTDFLVGFATGLAIFSLVFMLPVYLKIRKRLKGYKDDSDIYAA